MHMHTPVTLSSSSSRCASTVHCVCVYQWPPGHIWVQTSPRTCAKPSGNAKRERVLKCRCHHMTISDTQVCCKQCAKQDAVDAHEVSVDGSRHNNRVGIVGRDIVIGMCLAQCKIASAMQCNFARACSRMRSGCDRMRPG